MDTVVIYKARLAVHFIQLKGDVAATTRVPIQDRIPFTAETDTYESVTDSTLSQTRLPVPSLSATVDCLRNGDTFLPVDPMLITCQKSIAFVFDHTRLDKAVSIRHLATAPEPDFHGNQDPVSYSRNSVDEATPDIHESPADILCIQLAVPDHGFLADTATVPAGLCHKMKLGK
ncbi:hypothetical protein J6590_045218 [Homalodisca vitripennis]|nr:hypothetical protein J6590_045218 [Homalodisca vitripennis]